VPAVPLEEELPAEAPPLRGVVVCASALMAVQDRPAQIASAVRIFTEFFFIAVFG
jgi:hypothetical protein